MKILIKLWDFTKAVPIYLRRKVIFMKIISKKAAAMAFAIVVSALLFLLAAALLPIALSQTYFSRNGTDQKISYIDAKSSIEYAKAVLFHKLNTVGESVVSFYVTGAPNSAGVIQFEYTDGVAPGGTTTYAVCTYDDTNNAITIAADTSRLGFDGANLTYTTVYIPAGGSDPGELPPGFVQVGGNMGGYALVNGANHFVNAGDPVPYPVVFKSTVILDGNNKELTAPAIYFMGNPSITTTAGNVDLYANTYYFSGNLSAAAKNKGQVYIYRNGAATGMLYFNNVTISVASPAQSMTLNGFYSFTTNNFNLFDLNNLMSKITAVPASGTAAAKALYNAYVFDATPAQLDNMLNGEDISWVKDGEIKQGTVAVNNSQPGKTVFMYVDKVDKINFFSYLNYTADSIVLESAAGTWNFGSLDLTMTARFIYLNMDGSFRQGNAGASFIVNHTSGVTGNVILQFANSTAFKSSSGAVINTVPAGTYLCPSGTNLFGPGLNAKLTPYSGGTTSGGTSSTGTTSGSFGEALYVR